MKNAFMLGIGLGFVAGTYLFKHCPVVSEAVDTAETNIKHKVEECKDTMKRKKQQKSQMQNQETPTQSHQTNETQL